MKKAKCLKKLLKNDVADFSPKMKYTNQYINIVKENFEKFKNVEYFK